MPAVETKRRVTAMDTELSKDALDENDPGYQKPEPKEENTGRYNKPWKNKGKKYNDFNEKKDDDRNDHKDKDGDKRRDKHAKH